MLYRGILVYSREKRQREKCEEKRALGRSSTDRIILKWILKKQEMTMWTDSCVSGYGPAEISCNITQ
jgi:hypothetical protein